MDLLYTLLLGVAVQAVKVPFLPVGPPLPAPDYMVNNQGNSFNVAPDKGILNGPVIAPLNLSGPNPFVAATVVRPYDAHYGKERPSNKTLGKQQNSGYWLDGIAHGKMPYAPSDYTFYRNVRDYGAKGDGSTDDTAAINNAVSSGDRCGQTCGSTTITGALIYFPPGIYMVSTPIIQYYYTQFVGDPNDKPVIKGTVNFSGIALIDNDVYIPGGNGNEWYINQNQFYRQIRNFVVDLTAMPHRIIQGDQEYVPTGIHWQVAQATSLQNIDFKMPVSDSFGATTAVGIFMENGSGGFMSDLTFLGGNIGFRAGSQQFTARNLRFTSCLTAISMIWDWGFTWQNIYVFSCYVAIDCTQFGGIDGQGTGSISVVDSHFNGVPYAITTHAQGPSPNIVLDNLLVENSQSIVLISGGATILAGSSEAVTVGSWATGRRYTALDDTGSYVTGFVSPAPLKPPNLLDATGKYFTRSKPQYESLSAGSFLVATVHGVINDGSGDQTAAINDLLRGAGKTPVFFPAGVYLVKGTVHVPTGSVIVGECWSQIMATGSYFEDETNPKVMLQVGNPGDVGSVEISDMLFTVKGPTAGAILMEWNVHESTQGSAGMWDSHFRVGGAIGSGLQLKDCPKGAASVNSNCAAASMLMHVTSQSSGYFENVWAWVSDHDIDQPPNGNTTSSTQIDVYAARGILIESQGPTWLYGTASEHSILYQYQLLGAKDIYLGHMQTETPYFQASPPAPQPYSASVGIFPGDPLFEDCVSGSHCQEAWALRALNSTNVFIYSAGFYSFFQDHDQACVPEENCQERMVQTSYTESFWIYNLFTKGVVEIVSPAGGIPPVLQNDSNQSGYTSEISLWLPLALTGSQIGSSENSNATGSGIVYIDPMIWTEFNPVIQCYPPCVLVLPPLSLTITTTIDFPLYTTSLEVAWPTTAVTTLPEGSVSTSSGYGFTVETTTLTIPPVITTAINVWNVNITASQTETSSILQVTSSILPPPFTVTDNPNPESLTGVTHPPVTRTITPPPYPYTTEPTPDPRFPPLTWRSGPPSPRCTGHCGSQCRLFCHGPCLLDCFDGGETDFPDPIDPNNPYEPNQSSECTTETSSSCSTQCASGGSCTSTCSAVIGCAPTGISVASTITFAPAVSLTDEPWYSTTAALSYDRAVASSMDGYLDSLFPPSTSTPTSSSTPTPTPTPTSTPSNKFDLYSRELVVVTRGISQVTHSWYGFSVTTVGTYNVCTSKSVIQAYHDNSATYPTALGPFDLTGQTNCNYSGPDGNIVGLVSCDNGFKATCVAYSATVQHNYIDCTPDPDGSTTGIGRSWYYPRLGCTY